MKDLELNISQFTGFRAQVDPLPMTEVKGLALHLREAYKLYNLDLDQTGFLLVEPIHPESFRVGQAQNHLNTLAHVTGKTGVLLLDDLPAYMRSRLIEKRIQFIVPGKQIYLPHLLIHLREEGATEPDKDQKHDLTPAAQFLVLYYLIHHHEPWQLEDHPLKAIATRTGYSGNTITNVVDELDGHSLIEVRGTKEKFIRFNLKGKALWTHALQKGLLTTPVLKRMYVDEKPDQTTLLQANTTALATYTDISPDTQMYYAIHKQAYYKLKRTNKLTRPNQREGKYCLEVWAYDPVRLAIKNQNLKNVVDPLSLYLSLRETNDERIRMAMDHLINTMPW